VEQIIPVLYRVTDFDRQQVKGSLARGSSRDLRLTSHQLTHTGRFGRYLVGQILAPRLTAQGPAEFARALVKRAHLARLIPVGRYDIFVEDPFGNSGSLALSLCDFSGAIGDLESLYRDRNNNRHEEQCREHFGKGESGGAQVGHYIINVPLQPGANTGC